MPEGLNEEEQQVYRDQLSMFVVPIEERALEAYEGGYRKARELGIYNQWTVLMREGLTRMNDVEYPPIREVGGEIVKDVALREGVVIEGMRSAQGKKQPGKGMGMGKGTQTTTAPVPAAPATSAKPAAKPAKKKGAKP